MTAEALRQTDHADNQTGEGSDVTLHNPPRIRERAARQGRDGKLKDGKDVDTSQVPNRDASQPTNRNALSLVSEALKSGADVIARRVRETGQKIKSALIAAAEGGAEVLEFIIAWEFYNQRADESKRITRDRQAQMLYEAGCLAIHSADVSSIDKRRIGRHVQMARWAEPGLWAKDEAAVFSKAFGDKGVELKGKHYKSPIDALRNAGVSFDAVYEAFRVAIIQARDALKTDDERKSGMPKPATESGIKEAIGALNLKVRVADVDEETGEIVMEKDERTGVMKPKLKTVKIGDDRVYTVATVVGLLKKWTGKLTQADHDRIIKAMGEPVKGRSPRQQQDKDDKAA